MPGDAGAGGGGVARVRSQGRTEVGVVLCGRGAAGGGLKTAGRGGRKWGGTERRRGNSSCSGTESGPCGHRCPGPRGPGREAAGRKRAGSRPAGRPRGHRSPVVVSQEDGGGVSPVASVAIKKGKGCGVGDSRADGGRQGGGEPGDDGERVRAGGVVQVVGRLDGREDKAVLQREVRVIGTRGVRS